MALSIDLHLASLAKEKNLEELFKGEADTTGIELEVKILENISRMGIKGVNFSELEALGAKLSALPEYNKEELLKSRKTTHESPARG